LAAALERHLRLEERLRRPMQQMRGLVGGKKSLPCGIGSTLQIPRAARGRILPVVQQ
jgi:hypothetical protein